MSDQSKLYDSSLLKRVLKYVKPYKGLFISTAIITIVTAILAPIRPYLIQFTIDNYIAGFDAEMLLKMTLIMVLLLIVESVLQYFYAFSANLLGQSVIRDLRMDLFTKIIRSKLQYFDKTPIGTLVTRVVSDLETIAEIFSQGILLIIGDLLKIIVVVLVMFYVDFQLALVSLAALPLLLWSTYIFKNAIKSTFQEVRNEVAKLNAFVQEHVTGINIVQIFNREKVESDKFKAINKRHRDANIRSVWHYSIFFPVVEIISAISIGLLIWWASKQVLKFESTPGHIIAFILYINMLYRPIRELADRFNTLQMGMVASERVFKIMDQNEVIQDNGHLSLDHVKGNISFKNLWFAYKDEDWILKDLNLNVQEGEKIAIVGATGSGKTTIINVLGRFYEFQKGEILIDNVNIKEYTVAAVRKNIAFVLQDVFLFSDTIANNISLFDEKISREEIIEASKIVGAHDFIMKLPGDYDFNVRERGGMLSVGQRQLINFIRAYVFNPKILILDEATSSVDSESEELIKQATDKLTQNRTSIIIAHRLSTVQKCDKIIVMEKGKILEMGSHQELLSKDGHYKKLFELQFKTEMSI